MSSRYWSDTQRLNAKYTLRTEGYTNLFSSILQKWDDMRSSYIPLNWDDK